MSAEKKELYVGYYSPECEKLYGSTVWETLAGREVVITLAVKKHSFAKCNWPDAVLVSSFLTNYVRRQSVGNCGTMNPLTESL